MTTQRTTAFDLDRIGVASPCTASWDAMTGDDKSRFCGQCSKNVYNLSAMSRDEATRIIQVKEGGGLCVRFRRRADGTVLVGDCPVGWRAARRKVMRAAGSLLGLLIGIAAVGCRKPATPAPPATDPPAPIVEGDPDELMIMGDICVPEDLQPAGDPQPGEDTIMGKIAAPEPSSH